MNTDKFWNSLSYETIKVEQNDLPVIKKGNSALNATKLTMKDIYRACPETAEDEIVNDEVIGLLTAMYKNNEYLHLQKRLDWVYPYKQIDQESLEWLIDLFNEYEWRANRKTSGFEASDFDLFIEVYTPDMACVLTFYGKYDIVLYQDKVNNITAYYTYVLKDNTIYADLAGRLNMFYDNSVYSYSPMYSTKKDNDTAISPVRVNSSNDNPSGISTPSQGNNSNNLVAEKEDTKAKTNDNANMPTHDINSIYASKDTIDNVRANFVKTYVDISFSDGKRYEDYILDFDRLVPVYEIYSVNENTDTMLETLYFVGYSLPVTDSQGKIISIAGLSQILPVEKLHELVLEMPDEVKLSEEHAGEWRLTSYTNGVPHNNFFDTIPNAGKYIPQNSMLYYVISHNYRGVLAVSQGSEIFMPFNMTGSNNRYEPQNAKDILPDIIKDLTTNWGDIAG